LDELASAIIQRILGNCERQSRKSTVIIAANVRFSPLKDRNTKLQATSGPASKQTKATATEAYVDVPVIITV